MKTSNSKKILGDFITLQRGFDITKAQQSKGSHPVVSSGGIASYHNKFKVAGPGVVIGRKGTLGTAFYLETNFWPHDTSLWVKDFKGNNPKFVYYYLKALPLGKLDSGSANPTLNRNFAHLVETKFPPPAEQQRIAKVLSLLDRKIEVNNQIYAELAGAAKLLYDYWFVQFDFPMNAAQALATGDPALAGKPYRASGGKMVYNEKLKRAIPYGWEVSSLVDVATFTNGIACQKFPAGDGKSLKVIKIKEMRDGFTSNSDSVTVDVPQSVKVENGDILFSWSASLEVMLWAGGSGALNQHIFKVTSNSHPRSFIYFVLLDYLKHFQMIAELRKTTMGHITRDHLKQSRVCIPDCDTAGRFERRANLVIERLLLVQEENLQLAELRDWLLPMFMTGQVTPSQ